MRKLLFLLSLLGSNILTCISTVKEAIPLADHHGWYCFTLGALLDEISWGFEDFKTVQSEMHMISSPFTCSVDNASSNVLQDLIDL